jgi:hypothetical protein
MAARAQRPVVILPVLLALIGVISLAIAVMLVPVIIRESLAQARVASPQQLAPTAAPTAPAPTASPATTAPTEPAGGATGATAPPAAAAPDAGDVGQARAVPDQATTADTWSIRLDKVSYKPIEQGRVAFDELAAYLKSHPQTSAALTGINNPMRSRKKAKYAARRIKELLIDVGVERYRLRTAGAQEEGARGLVVRAEIAGADR